MNRSAATAPSFNSLFEMHVPSRSRLVSSGKRLSILYLRCRLRGAAVLPSQCDSFNSLFEMHAELFESALRTVASQPFNSLFEMLAEIVFYE